MRKPRKPAAAPATPKTKTYVMGLKGGQLRRVTVPAHWKVTFGPIVPFAKNGYSGSESGLSLRFYEGKDHQRAVFTDVLWFRDQSLKVEERITKKKQKIMEKDTPSGRKGVIVEASITEWRNAEEPEEAQKDDAEFLQIEDHTDAINF